MTGKECLTRFCESLGLHCYCFGEYQFHRVEDYYLTVSYCFSELNGIKITVCISEWPGALPDLIILLGHKRDPNDNCFRLYTHRRFEDISEPIMCCCKNEVFQLALKHLMLERP